MRRTPSSFVTLRVNAQRLQNPRIVGFQCSGLELIEQDGEEASRSATNSKQAY